MRYYRRGGVLFENVTLHPPPLSCTPNSLELFQKSAIFKNKEWHNPRLSTCNGLKILNYVTYIQ